MALTGDQIEEITRSLAQLYQGAEAAIVEQVTRQLATGIDAADWATNRLGALSILRQAVEAILAAVAEEGAEEIRDALGEAYRTGAAAATAGVPAGALPQAPAVAQAAAAASEAGIRAAVVERLAVALVQDVGQKHSNVLRHVEDVYRRVIAQAAAVSVAGGVTRREAAQHAYARLVDQGITSFTDSRGRQWRLSSYVEMGTRTVVQRAAVQGQTDRLTRLGVDTVIVSNSPKECPLCRPWEGKVLSISGNLRGRVELESVVRKGERVTVEIAGSVEQARAAGLQHPNCTHALRAYLAGAAKVPKGDLADPKGYEAKQRQREIERHIRRWKEREAAALTPEAKTTAAGKVRAWQAAMRDHLKANPSLKRLPYRETPGAGNLPRKGTSTASGRAGTTGGSGTAAKATKATTRPPRQTSAPPQAAAPKPPAAPKAPPAPPPAAPQPRNPDRLTGSVQREWWDSLKADTDVPIPVTGMQIPGGYTIRSGKVVRRDGVAYLVEDGIGGADFATIVDELQGVHRALPDEAGQVQQAYLWLAGRNPDDAYWEQKYGRAGFESLATAGDGAVRVWARRGKTDTPKSLKHYLEHEFGHNVGKAPAIKARGLGDDGQAWRSATGRAPTPVYSLLELHDAHRLTLQPNPSKPFPHGVTEYGQSSVGEDYAESMRLYLRGVIGRGKLAQGGHTVRIYFRDIFPDRAAILDQIFPSIKERQLRAIANR